MLSLVTWKECNTAQDLAGQESRRAVCAAFEEPFSCSSPLTAIDSNYLNIINHNCEYGLSMISVCLRGKLMTPQVVLAICIF